MNTEKFIKGFRRGDIILKESDRYVEVQNGYQKFIIGDNGERRIFSIQLGEMVVGNLVTNGTELSLSDIKEENNVEYLSESPAEFLKSVELSERMTKPWVDIARFNVITIGDTQFNVVKEKKGGVLSITILSFRGGDRYFAEIEVDTEKEWQELFNAIDEEWIKDNFYRLAN